MPPDRSSFTALNTPSSHLPEYMGLFTLSAAPNTDLWRKPPAQNISTAPILFTALRHPFFAAEVTVSADWELEWDQGGLVIFAGSPQGIRTLPSPTPSIRDSPPSPAPPPPYTPHSAPAPKWVRLGLEYTAGTPSVSSVVATSDGADWCVSALSAAYMRQRRADLRIKMERIGYALWLWYYDDSIQGEGPAVVAGGEPYPVQYPAGRGVWRKVREVTWFFWGVEDKAVRVGVYACRPVAGGAGGSGSASTSTRNNHGEERRRDLAGEFEGLEIF